MESSRLSQVVADSVAVVAANADCGFTRYVSRIWGLI